MVATAARTIPSLAGPLIAGVNVIKAGQRPRSPYQTSWPCAGPQSVSRCRFLGVIPETSSSSEYLRFTGEVEREPVPFGESARLLPHLASRASFGMDLS